MHTRLKAAAFLSSITACFIFVGTAHAAPASIVYTYDHHIFTVSVTAHPEWKRPKRVWLYKGVAAEPPAELKTCGKDDVIPPDWSYRDVGGWSEDVIALTLDKEIASKLDRPAGRVTIGRTASGTVTFDGIGLPGRHVNLALAARLTRTALESNVSTVSLPVTHQPADVTVTDPELKAAGIKEVVTVGESVFAGSPINRRHNIGVGARRFNGHLIPQDSVFSFVGVLGPVDQTAGYRKELVIQGDKTLPDYGGGLCQVSSTAYRGPWEYGMPIVQRKNHSYAVSYYSPQGTDATIYPPNVDIKFRNDTPGALLIQTHIDDVNHLFFIYYGTRDNRTSEVFGPYISNRVAAPKEERILYTTDIAPGEKRKAGERHDGMSALWYRTVQKEGTGATLERYFSLYEARPFTWQIGVAPGAMETLTGDDESESPSWLPISP